MDVANNHSPIKRSRVSGAHMPWLTSHLSQLMHKRDLYHRRALKSKSQAHWSLYRKIQNTVNKEIKESKSAYYSKLIEDNKNNSSVLRETLAEVTSRNVKNTINSIEADDIIYSNHRSIASFFNQYFSSTGSKLADRLKSILPVLSLSTEYPRVSTSFCMEPINVQFVLDKLKHIKPNKAIGMDKISSRLLKDAADIIAPSLTNLV